MLLNNKIPQASNTYFTGWIRLIVDGKNQRLQNLLKEKEWPLKGSHHWVKNNSHSIICLLESWAFILENGAPKAIEESKHRILAMFLMYQKLYLTKGLKSINMSDFY